MGGLTLRDFVIAGLSALISTGTAVLMWLLTLRKTKAEIERLDAEKLKIRAETSDLNSNRMFRELDRLSDINDEHFSTIEKQRTAIRELRTQVEHCAEREIEFVATEKSLRLEIENLRGPVLPMNFEVPINQILKKTFPPDIPHPDTPDADEADESSRD